MLMLRLISHHWFKLGVFAVLYAIGFACLGTLTNVQIDAMQNQVQLVDYKSFGTK
jgi:hypothetical protein